MQVTFNKTGDLSATLRVDVAKTDYQPEIEKELKKLQKQANVPGFRPGTAPMQMIKKTYGKSLQVDEVNKLASKYMFDYLKENNIDFLGQPLLSETEESKIDFDKEDDFSFVFDLGLAPQFDVNIGKGDVLTRYKITIEDKMIDDEVANLQRRNATITDVETAEEKDVIYAEVTELGEDNMPLDGGLENKPVSLTADLVKNEELKNQLIGIAKGTEMTVDIFELFNGNETVISSSLGIAKEGVRDLNKNFRLRVTEIKRYVDADLNQELFDKVYGPGVVGNEEQLRAKIAEDLKFYYENEAEHQLEHNISHLIGDKHDFELPDAFLKRWLMETRHDTYNKGNIESKYAQEKAGLRYVLVREKIENANQININDEEIQKAALGYTYNLFSQYGMYNPDPATVQAFAQEQLNKESFKNQMRDVALNRAIIQAVKNMITVEDKEVSADEFYAIIQAHNETHAHDHNHEHDHSHEGHDHDHDHDHEHAHSH